MKKLLFCLIIFFTFFTITGCGKELKIVDKLDFEINSILKMNDLIVLDEDIQIVNGDDLIDTSILGEKEVVIKYYSGKKENYTSIKINVVDTVPPVIENSTDKVTITKGSKPNLLNGVKVTDNSNEKINPTIEGEYDINKVGEYKLKYVAVDSSLNRTEKEFTLVVKNISVKTSGYYVYKANDYWAGIAFKSNKNVTIEYNYCPKATMEGFGCGGYQAKGTYKVDGDKITITFSIAYTDTGTDKSIKGDKMKCTIKSESKIVCSNKNFSWAKKFL